MRRLVILRLGAEMPRSGLRARTALSLLSAGTLTFVAACSDGDGEPEAVATASSTALASEAAGGGAGPIVFKRLAPARDETDIYTVNPDGSNVELLFRGPAEFARWSPDGSQISLFCCDDGEAGHFVDVASGELRTFPPPDPEMETFCGGAWTPDGTRVACEAFGVNEPKRNGIYTVRAADGGGLTRVTSNPGGSDLPGDYSPDGTRLVFLRSKNERPVGFFVTNGDGSGLQRLTPKDAVVDDSGFAGSWSPDGDKILLVLLASAEHHKAIWTVNPDGTDLEQLPIVPECGGPFAAGEYGCYSPRWSPDGEQIVFTRSDGAGESIYIVNADGSGLVQVTDGEDDQPVWGTPAR